MKYNYLINNNKSNIRNYTNFSCINNIDKQNKNNIKDTTKDKSGLVPEEQISADIKLIPAKTYINADTQKIEILNGNQEKSGIYRWTLNESGKFYIGSAENIKRRLKDYYNVSYLENEIKKNNSLIYRVLLKYGYSAFSLDIIEYCDKTLLIEKEQYYLDLLKPEYNLLKFAYSLSGFKHSDTTKELMRSLATGRTHTEKSKQKMTANSATSQTVIFTNNKSGESKEFVSIRRVADYINKHHSYIAKSLNKNGIYKGKYYIIRKR